jgi:hypothetical protein
MWTDADEKAEIVRVAHAMEDQASVFVFGSNEAGLHGGGAAQHAHQRYGAVWGVGAGLQGRAYAWPTKSADFVTLSLPVIEQYALDLVVCAGQHPGKRFIVTRVGCGLAGLTDEQMASTLPVDLPSNIELPPVWVAIRRNGEMVAHALDIVTACHAAERVAREVGASDDHIRAAQGAGIASRVEVGL